MSHRYSYTLMPAWFWRAPVDPLARRFWLQCRQGGARLPPVTLTIRPERGNGCAIENAHFRDFWIRVELNSGSAALDLYWHYIAFAGLPCRHGYHAIARACQTYVKFGECIQECVNVHLTLRPRSPTR